MKKILAIYLFAFLLALHSDAAYKTFYSGKEFVIKTKDYKTAAKVCYKFYTGGVYRGEEESLSIIDACVNLKEFND